MSLNDLINWARDHSVDFEKPIEVGGWDGIDVLTERMIEKRRDGGIDLDASE